MTTSTIWEALVMNAALNIRPRHFPGGPVAENPPSYAGGASSIPGWGTKIPQATGELSPRTTATEPAHSGACKPQLKKPTSHNKDPAQSKIKIKKETSIHKKGISGPASLSK